MNVGAPMTCATLPTLSRMITLRGCGAWSRPYGSREGHRLALCTLRLRFAFRISLCIHFALAFAFRFALVFCVLHFVLRFAFFSYY